MLSMLQILYGYHWNNIIYFSWVTYEHLYVLYKPKFCLSTAHLLSIFWSSLESHQPTFYILVLIYFTELLMIYLSYLSIILVKFIYLISLCKLVSKNFSKGQMTNVFYIKFHIWFTNIKSQINHDFQYLLKEISKWSCWKKNINSFVQNKIHADNKT